MAGWRRNLEQWDRCRAGKTAGAVLLGLLSSVLGCQGTVDHLRQNASNEPAATAAAERSSPPASLTSGQVAPPKQDSTNAALASIGTKNSILQVGATKVVPLGSASAVSEPSTSIVRAADAKRDPDGEEPEERKWTAAPAADENKAGSRRKGASEDDKGYQVDRSLPSPTAGMATPIIPAPKNVAPVTLAGALRQAGAENPVIAIAQQAVQSALGLQLQARVLLLPSVNVGANYNDHTGPLIASFGGIRKISKDLVYYGLGANTVAAETIKIPGLLISTALADAIFSPRAASHTVASRRFAAMATRNDIFLEVSTGYLALMNAEALLAIIRQSERDFEEVARLTQAFAKTGAGRVGDAERAEADRLALRYAELHAQQEVAVASADLSQLLNLDPSTRLVTGDIPLQVVQFVDPQVPLPKLLELAERNHPALLAAAAAIRASQVNVRREKARPLLPILWTGFSAGDFGGGAVATAQGNGVYNPHTGNENLVTIANGQTVPKFGKIAGRMDYDVFAFWQLQNLGFGNLALIRRSRAELGQAEANRLRVLNDVREQVSVAFNRSAENFRAIGVQRRRVQEATEGFQRDLTRIRGGVGLPIEVLDNATRLREAREALLAAVIGFDRAQFELFVALGQPPTLVVEDDKPPAPPVPPDQLPPPNVLLH